MNIPVHIQHNLNSQIHWQARNILFIKIFLDIEGYRLWIFPLFEHPKYPHHVKSTGRHAGYILVVPFNFWPLSICFLLIAGMFTILFYFWRVGVGQNHKKRQQKQQQQKQQQATKNLALNYCEVPRAQKTENGNLCPNCISHVAPPRRKLCPARLLVIYECVYIFVFYFFR